MGCALSANRSKQKLSLHRLESKSKPWSHVLSLTLDQVEGTAIEEFGLRYPLDLTTRKARLQPWCLQGRHFEAYLPAPVDTLYIDVKYIYDELLIKEMQNFQEKRVALQESYLDKLDLNPKTRPFLETANVVGVRDETAVVQIVLQDEKCIFFIVNLQTSTVIGKYEPLKHGKPVLMECYISPDYKHFLLKPNHYFCQRFQIYIANECLTMIGVQNEVEEINEISVDKFTVLSKHFEKRSIDLNVAFDPRFQWSRVAIGNVVQASKFSLVTYCLKKKAILKVVDVKHSERIQNICYSPSGSFVAVLFTNRNISTHQTIFNYTYVKLYQSSDLQQIHQIPINGLTSVSTCAPESLFPVFSLCGHHLIVPSGNGSMLKRLEIYNTTKEINLKHLCRLALITFLDDEQMDNLKVEESLKKFILFEPYME